MVTASSSTSSLSKVVPASAAFELVHSFSGETRRVLQMSSKRLVQRCSRRGLWQPKTMATYVDMKEAEQTDPMETWADGLMSNGTSEMHLTARRFRVLAFEFVPDYTFC